MNRKLVPEVQKIYDKLQKDYDARKKKQQALCNKMEKELREKDHRRLNWISIVDYDFAHCKDGMEATKVDPCPLCDGKGTIIGFDEDAPAYGYTWDMPCRTCKGKGVAWFKYGEFDIERDNCMW